MNEADEFKMMGDLIVFLLDNGYSDPGNDITFLLNENNKDEVIKIFGESNDYVNFCIKLYTMSTVMFSLSSALYEIYKDKETVEEKVKYIMDRLVDIASNRNGE